MLRIISQPTVEASLYRKITEPAVHNTCIIANGTLASASCLNVSTTHLAGVDVGALAVDVRVVLQEGIDSRIGSSGNGQTSIAGGDNMGDMATRVENAGKAQHLQRGP